MNRRKLLLAGGVTLSTVLAGCSNGETGAENGNGSVNGNGGNGGDSDGTGDEENNADNDNGEEEGNGTDESDNGDENDDGGFDIEPGTTIELDAQLSDWTGISPSQIKGESNPPLILQAGETYTIGWTQGIGGHHNIAIGDGSGNVVKDYATEIMATDEITRDNQMLEFTASGEMAEYVCNIHSSTMVGELQVEGSNEDHSSGNSFGDSFQTLTGFVLTAGYPRVAESYEYEKWTGETATHHPGADEQFAFVDLTVTNEGDETRHPPSRRTFQLIAGGELYEPMTYEYEREDAYSGSKDLPRGTRESGVLAFTIPADANVFELELYYSDSDRKTNSEWEMRWS